MGFFGVALWTFIILKTCSWCLKKTRGRKYILIYINGHGILKICNVNVYMHLRVYMHEPFYLIINPLKYKCETHHVFIHPY
jgi:hypothetical protein